MHAGPTASDKLLFTPGPLTTSPSVKQAMLRDLGSRDPEFLAIVKRLRQRLLALCDVAEPAYCALPLQGSGTYAVEATLGTVVPRGGKLLVLENGAYGERLAILATRLGLEHRRRSFPEVEPVDPGLVAKALDADPALTFVAVVHCETSTGLVNPVEELAAVCRARGRELIVDAMSSFGALPLPLGSLGIGALVSSANKCLQGVPGCGLVVAKRSLIEAGGAHSRSVSLDLSAQLRGFDRDGQFRFTPPTHVLLALDRALDELDAEGGIAGRARRYQGNQALLLSGMQRLGFQTLLAPSLLSPIITAFLPPPIAGFQFSTFYRLLSERGLLIYPGKVSRADSFRIGTIGHLFPADFERLLAAIAEVLPLVAAAGAP